MKNLFISNLHKKDAEHCTTNFGLFVRRKIDKPFKKACNIFTNANIIRLNESRYKTDEEYFSELDMSYIPAESYNLRNDKNNIVLERYPDLEKDEPYIFVCNHTCPEDIETVLNIIDRNAYLILGSIESLQYNREMYLLFINGMIPFDILDDSQRELVMNKMIRVLKTNSILIFPEGSHNLSPNKLVNNLFDGPSNLALQTGRKIVIVTLVRDDEKEVSYIDVSNPIDVKDIEVDMNIDFEDEKEIEKYYVNKITEYIRDKMATRVYNVVVRHFEQITRTPEDNLEEKLRLRKIEHAFEKLKWNRDVFKAEYLTKKSSDEKVHEKLLGDLSRIFPDSEWDDRKQELDKKDVIVRMRQHLSKIKQYNSNKNKIKKKY